MGLENMFWRALSTTASLTVAVAAVAVIDCMSAALRIFSDDPLGVCAAADSLDADLGVWVGIGLAVFAVIALVATWVPAARPGAKRRRLRPENSLSSNLARLPDLGIEAPDPGSASDAHLGRVTRRLEVIEAALDDEETPTREVTRQWMELLRDVNDLHNRDELATEDFKEINTRLVGLFAGPAERPERLAATS